VTSEDVDPMPIPTTPGGQHFVTFSLTTFTTFSNISSSPDEGLSVKRYEQFSLPPPFRLASIKIPAPGAKQISITGCC